MSLGGQQHAAQHAQRGRLARAVGSQESIDAPGADVEVDVIDGGLGAEFPGELPRGDRRSGAGRSGGGTHGASSSSETSTGTPEGKLAASGSSKATSARKLKRERSAAVSA